MHTYLLASQRGARKATVSTHAAHSASAYRIYVLGHFFGGLFFVIFAYKFFYQQLGSTFLLGAAIGGVLSEWIQALVPYKGKSKNYHTFFAWCMGFFMLVILFTAPFIVGLEGNGIIALLTSIAILVSCIIVGLVVRLQKFWLPQMMYFFLFYVVMIILLS